MQLTMCKLENLIAHNAKVNSSVENNPFSESVGFPLYFLIPGCVLSVDKKGTQDIQVNTKYFLLWNCIKYFLHMEFWLHNKELDL